MTTPAPMTAARTERREPAVVRQTRCFGFEDGRIVEAWGMEDTLDRIRQLGLAEPS
jgi:hypothetical protein